MKFAEPTLEEQILKTKDILKNGYANLLPTTYTTYYKSPDGNSLVYKPYIFTNENLHYFKKLTDFSEKEVLVPTASGDQAFNALFLGAKSVETFDINSIAKYFFNLKETAIKYLSRNEFLEFYSCINLFNPKYYNKIRIKLKSQTRFFFDSLYEFVGEKICLLENLPEEIYLKQDQIIKSNPYLENEETYLKMKQILFDKKSHINHKVCSAEDIVDLFDKKDIIILSNIYGAYLLINKNKATYDKYLKNIPELLEKDGTISLNYIFGCTIPENKKYLLKEIKKELPSIKKLEIESQRASKTEKTRDTILYTDKESTITR